MTSFLLSICFASSSSRLLFNEKRLIRRGRAFVVASSRRTTSPLSSQYRQRRWRYGPSSPAHKKQRSPSPSSSSLRRSDFFARITLPLSDTADGPADDPAAFDTPHRYNAIDLAAVEQLFELSSAGMEARVAHPTPPPRPRLGSRAGASPEAEAPSVMPRRSTETMPPPSAGAFSNGEADADDGLDTRPSRSASSASRTNRLSLTLPIAPPTAFPTRPTPSSTTNTSFPPTPISVKPGLNSPADPGEFISAIATQERLVLELREELKRAETGLTKLKRQWATHEAHRKRAEIRRKEPMRSMPAKPAAATATASASDPAAAESNDQDASKRSVELDRRRALLLGQQPGSSLPSTPTTTQSRRRVFAGGHTRTLSLLSPTKTSMSDFPVHEDNADDGGDPAKSPKSPSSTHEPDSPFYQSLGRYAPLTAAQLSKRASWAPQSVHQVAGLKQVAGDLTATLWTFVEDLRQATVGEELLAGGAGPAMRSIDGNSRTAAAANDDLQNTIRASSSSARQHVSKAFADDLQATPTPASRHSPVLSDQQQQSASGSSSSSSSNSSRTRPARAESKASKSSGKTKRFSWTPLTVDSYDDSDWSSWDSPTVKSPRWSGSTVNEAVVPASPEEANENVTPVKQTSITSPVSPSRGSDIAWPAALNRLTPGNIKRTATDLMKEWEKSLAEPMELAPAEDAMDTSHM